MVKLMKILDLFNFFYNIPIAWYPVLFLLMGGVFFSFFLIRNRFFTTSQKEWIYFSQPTLKKIFTFLMFISLLFCLVIWLNVVRFVPDRLASFVDKDSLLVAGMVNAVDYAVNLDAFGAFSALFFSVILFSSALSAALDKESIFTPSIAIFEIIVFAGFLGIFYTDSLFIIGFCLFMVQLGVSGLIKQWVKGETNAKDIRKTNVVLRLLLAGLFLLGVLLLKLKYHTTLLSALIMPLVDSRGTKLAFVFVACPLLYLFTKPSGHVSVPSMNVYFKLKSLVAFYAFLKLFFLLFATIEGYERVSLFLLISGLLLLLYALMIACKEQSPLSMMNSTESFIKGLLLISAGIGQYGIYSGEKAIFLGIPGLQAMLLLWMFFLPLSALFSYMTAYMEQKIGEQYLWQTPSLLKKIPHLIFVLVLIVFTATGIPPFGGFLFYQLLLRASLFISPNLTYVLFMLSLLFLLFSLRFILAISFASASSVEGINNVALPALEKKFRVPMIIAFVLCSGLIFFPGLIFDTLISSCVEALTLVF